MADEIRALMTLKEVAWALDVELTWLHRHIARLRRDHGFPKPLPVFRKYDPASIEAWQRRCWSPETTATIAINTDVVDFDAERARMDARARNLA